jgi:hypothetical protein
VALYTLDAASERELAGLQGGFARRVRIWLFLCWFILSLRVLVVDGRRTPAEQEVLRRQNPKNTGTVHLDGLAVDVNFLDSKTGAFVLRKADPAAKWAKVYALAKLCGIENGSGFPGYPDNNHFFRRK